MNWYRKWKLKKAEWKIFVRNKTEEATARALTSFFKKLGIDNACERFLKWADKNRKVMCCITISFLIFVTGVSIFHRPTQDWKETLKEERDKIDVAKHNPLNKQPKADIKEMFEVMKLKSNLDNRSELTSDDTLMIKELYQKIKDPKK